jgi:hypothetical protein
MTANDYIDYDPSTTKFSISEEHAKVLCDRDSSAYTIPFVYWIQIYHLRWISYLKHLGQVREAEPIASFNTSSW